MFTVSTKKFMQRDNVEHKYAFVVHYLFLVLLENCALWVVYFLKSVE